MYERGTVAEQEYVEDTLFRDDDLQLLETSEAANYDDNNMGGSPGELSEELVTQEKRKKGWRMNCDVGEATEGLENELWRR